jgi:hypothetical protein
MQSANRLLHFNKSEELRTAVLLCLESNKSASVQRLAIFTLNQIAPQLTSKKEEVQCHMPPTHPLASIRGLSGFSINQFYVCIDIGSNEVTNPRCCTPWQKIGRVFISLKLGARSLTKARIWMAYLIRSLNK